MNLTMQDCLDMSGLSDDELLAIARHEKIPPIVALELGHRLIQTPKGVETLRQFILDDIMGAQRLNRCEDCEQFSRTLADYNEQHPDRRKISPEQAELLRELMAIGHAVEIGRIAEDPGEPQTAALHEVEEAKERHDCRACGRLSLALVRLFESAGDDRLEQDLK